ncbi:ABC transporter substrate-binding protein [Synergistales bacterium]|nr:ABC transporter substrate-binding protein [Synergistales bacterium]
MRKLSKFAIALLLVFVSLLVGCEAARAAYRLSLATYDPVTSGQTKKLQEWADRIKEKTSGQVDITLFPGGSLASAAEILDAVKTGAADIGWVYTSFYPKQFPVTDAITLPLLGVKTTTQGTSALWDLYQDTKAFQDELSANNLKMLMMYTNPRNFIATAKKPVKTIDDLKGLKMRAPAGTATDMLVAWGGTPIMMGPGDVFQALEKGVLDGYVFEYNGIDNFKLQEISKYYTEITFYVGPFLTLMNKGSFESLPAEFQKVIEEESGRKMSMELAALFQIDADNVRTKILSSGGEAIEVTGDALAGFSKAAESYAQAWVDRMKSAAFDSQAYLAKLKSLIAQYDGK